jgi:hypothetical protein
MVTVPDIFPTLSLPAIISIRVDFPAPIKSSLVLFKVRTRKIVKKMTS